MIGVKLGGRLGNQMFQYAFAINTSEELDHSFFLIKDGEPADIYKYFKLKKTFFYYTDITLFNHAGYRLFFSHYLRTWFYNIIVKCFTNQYVDVHNTDSPSLLKINDKSIYRGYFQSELYFKKHLSKVARYFELKNEITTAYQKHNRFPDGSVLVTIHIRKTDYLELAHLNLGGDDLSLPFSYYHQLIKGIHNENNYYIFISDDTMSIISEFDYLPNKYISTGNVITDFQHMLNADICIISNSTFSWWAAYLNKKPGKVVYCPKYFLGFLIKEEYPANIYPGDWNQIEIFV